MGKGDKRRPRSIGPEEERLRYALAFGKITFTQFERRYKQLLREGKIVRDGRVIGEHK